MEQVSLVFVKEAGCELYAPASFLTADRTERDLVCNGCGTSGLGGYLVPDDMWGLCVTIVCDIHDWMYELAVTDEDEDLADYYFKCNLRRFIRSKGKGRPFVTAMRLVSANVYFAFVALTYYSPAARAKVKKYFPKTHATIKKIFGYLRSKVKRR